MQFLNRSFKGKLNTAIKIFRNRYHRRCFHQLVSSQLDIDRLDYLRRDSFFTGVSEGTIGADRIIKMLDIHKDQLVVEEKGIYSIENFLNARRLMYWQVYLHKTSVAAEKMMVQLMLRAQMLTRSGYDLEAPTGLKIFLENSFSTEDLKTNPAVLHAYCQLDDYDIWSAIKQWQYSGDFILSSISRMFLNRELFQIKLGHKPFAKTAIQRLRNKIKKQMMITYEEASFLVCYGSISNAAYISGDTGINILSKSGAVIDIAKASDLPNIKALSKIVKKYYLCWPKSVNL